MVRTRALVLLAATPLVLAVACGGGGSDGSSCEAPPDIAGAWSGSLTDDQAGGGTLALSFSQNECALGGTWQATFSSATFDSSGTITGSASGDTVSFTLLSPAPGTCGYHANGSLDGANEISGPYSTIGTNCSRSGTFDILRQITATPTALGTSTATPGGSPTPTPTSTPTSTPTP